MTLTEEEASAMAEKDLYDFLNKILTCDIRQLHLSENFYLPVFLKTYRAKEYEYLEKCLTNAQLLSLLQANLQLFRKNLEEKGVQIFENNVKIEFDTNYCIAKGSVILIEKAGKSVERITTE